MLSDPKKQRVVGVSERATIRPESLVFFLLLCVFSARHTFVFLRQIHACLGGTQVLHAPNLCVLPANMCLCVCVSTTAHMFVPQGRRERKNVYIYILHHTNMSIVATHMYKPSFVDPRDALETSSLRKVACEVSASGKLKSVSYFF